MIFIFVCPTLPFPPSAFFFFFPCVQDVAVAFFAVGWFQTLFLYTSRMPSETLMWLWDVWVTERSFKVSLPSRLTVGAPNFEDLGPTWKIPD